MTLGYGFRPARALWLLVAVLAATLASRPAEAEDRDSATVGKITILNRKAVDGRSVELLTAELAAAANGHADAAVIVSADALASHQSVINVLDAARRAGLGRLTFASQTANAGR